MKQRVAADKYIVVDDARISVEGWEHLTPQEFVKNPYGKS